MQAGKLKEVHIKNAYSLLGLTTPGQLISLIKKCDIVITLDNFIMHAAHLVGTPAVILWGPTDPLVYGYEGQRHLKDSQICELAEECIGPDCGSNYQKPCPLGERHCMNQISLEDIYNSAMELLEEIRDRGR
jgi:ADP-heptose:LPS heptosyltransferase